MKMPKLGIETKKLVQLGNWSCYRVKENSYGAIYILSIPEVHCGCPSHQQVGKVYMLDEKGNCLGDAHKTPDYRSLGLEAIESVDFPEAREALQKEHDSQQQFLKNLRS